MLDQHREELGTTIMRQRDPNLVTSGLSGRVTQDGITVEICICRLEHEKLWTLEVVNAAGTSVVWDEQFSSDEEAYAEFKREPLQMKACKPFSTKATSFHLGAEMVQVGYCRRV